ncbi:hypothetical protein [Amorphus sp. MBR-141]
MDRKISQIAVDDIEAMPGRRPVSPDAVSRIADSMSAIGLRIPVTVRYFANRPSEDGSADDSIVLVTGAHRLAAAKKLGWEKIDAYLVECDDTDAELWEISENLHRSELTALERQEQIARWVELTDQKVSGQVAQKPQGGRPEGGLSAATRELGVERTAARRAVKVASLTDEAKAAAREVGVDDNNVILLEAAKAAPDRQADVIRHEAARRTAPKSNQEMIADQVEALLRLWNKSSPQARQMFIEQVDQPVMDGRFGS